MAQMDDVEYAFKRVYFESGDVSLERFWTRLGGRPDVTGAKVLDVGCGVGHLVVDLGLRGARRVVGLDINERSIKFARQHVQRERPDLVDAVEFQHADVRDYPEGGFDVVVSKDSFEHIMELDAVLAAMRDRVAPGGRIYIGFGPLYRGPFGDHRWTRLRVPWAHLVVPERIVVERLNRWPDLLPSWAPRHINSIHDLGLNKQSLADYERIIRSSGLSTVYFRTNAGTHPIVRLSSLLARLPPLGEYLTHNLYCILQRPAA